MTIGQRLLRTARKAQEDLAAREFSREKIFAACQEAASKGLTSCLIKPSLPVDVSSTDFMKALRPALEKERLQVTWLPHGLPGDPAYKVMEIRWVERS